MADQMNAAIKWQFTETLDQSVRSILCSRPHAALAAGVGAIFVLINQSFSFSYSFS